MKTLNIFIILTCLFTLTHCTPYDLSRPIIKQGNLLPKAKLDHLKIGMSKEDVATLLGTSLLPPVFTNDRWDYAFTFREGAGPTVVHSLSLYFTRNSLVAIEHSP